MLSHPLLRLEVHDGEVLVVGEGHPDVGLGHSWVGAERAELGARPGRPAHPHGPREPALPLPPPARHRCPRRARSPMLLNWAPWPTAPLVKVSAPLAPAIGPGKGTPWPELQPCPPPSPAARRGPTATETAAACQLLPAASRPPVPHQMHA